MGQGKYAGTVEQAVAPRAANDIFGPYNLQPGDTVTLAGPDFNGSLNINHIYFNDPIAGGPWNYPTGWVGTGVQVNGPITINGGSLMMGGYAGYSISGPISITGAGKMTVSSGTDLAGPLAISGGDISVSGYNSNFTAYTNSFSFGGTAAATTSGTILISGTGGYLMTIHDPYGIWTSPDRNDNVSVAWVDRVYGAAGLSPTTTTTIALSGTGPYDGQAVTVYADRTTSYSVASNVSAFSGNLTADGAPNGHASTTTYRYFDNMNFASSQLVSATNGGVVNIQGNKANLPGANITFNANVGLNAGSTINVTDFQNVTVGSNSSANLLVGAGTLNFVGTGVGAQFAANGGATLGAKATGALLSVTNFQNFTSDGTNPLTAINGGTVVIGGSNTAGSVLTINPTAGGGQGIIVGGTGSTNTSTLTFKAFSDALVAGVASAGSYGSMLFTGIGVGSTFTAKGGTLAAANTSSLLDVGYVTGYENVNITSNPATGANSTLSAANTGQLILNGSGATANLFLDAGTNVNVSTGANITFSGFNTENVQTPIAVPTNSSIYFGGAPGGMTIGAPNAPVNLTATGTGALLWTNYAYGSTGNLTFYGDALASQGGKVFIDGTQAGNNSAQLTGNLAATGANSQILYRYYANPAFAPSQNLTATGGGYLQVRGGFNTANANLNLNSNLNLGAGSTMDFLYYQTAVVGSTAGAGLLVGAGTLRFSGSGAPGSSFTAAGGSRLGATAYGASLYVGDNNNGLTGFETFTATASNPIIVTGGGTMYAVGTQATNSKLTVASGANITVGGTGSSFTSSLLTAWFNTTEIDNDLGAGSYGTIGLGGSPGGFNIGSPGSTVKLTATGAGAILWVDYNAGITGNLAFYGDALASGGGEIVIDGSPSGNNTALLTGNLSATGAGSRLFYRYYANPTFTPSQTLTATGGAYFYNWAGANSSTANLNLNANLNLGAGSSMNFYSFHTAVVGSTAGAGLLVKAGTLTFTSDGRAGSSFTAAGGSALGATAVGANLYVGTASANGFEAFTATASNTIQVTGGGTMYAYGLSTPNSKLTIGPDANIIVGGTGSTSQSLLSFSGFTTTEIDHDVTAGAYGSLYIGGSTAGINIGSSGSPVHLTATGTNALLWIDYNAAATGNLAFYGDALATNGGEVVIDGTQGGTNTAVLAANLSAAGANSVLYYRYYANPVFANNQLVSASAGGTVYLYPTSVPAGNSLTLSPGPNVAFKADGANSVINAMSFNRVNLGAPVGATNSGTVNFKTIGNPDLAMTTAGDPSGNVNVTGRAASGSYPTLSLANVQAIGCNLNFSLFGPYTLGPTVEANGGGLNFTGFTTGGSAGIPFVQQSPMAGDAGQGYGISSINGGWGLARDLPFNTVPLFIDGASSYSLQDVAITGASITDNGVLYIAGVNTVNTYGLYTVSFAQDAYPLSGTGTINVQVGATLTTATPSSQRWTLPSTMTLTGQGTVRQMTTPNAGTILTDTTGTLTIVPEVITNPTTLTNTGTIRWRVGGQFDWTTYNTIDNQGLMENISTTNTLTSVAPLQLPALITSTGNWGTLRANGAGVAIDLLAPNMVIDHQVIDATNGAFIKLNGRDLTSVNLTSGAGGILYGGDGAVGGTQGTTSQDVSALSTLTNATLTGASSVLTLAGSQKVAVNPAGTGLTVTSGGTLLLAGTGGHQVLSSVGNQLARISVNGNGTIQGAGNAAAHQVGLTADPGGTIAVNNSGLTSTAPNPALLPVFNQGSGTWSTTSPVAGNDPNQTLTVLGDLQMSAGSTLSVNINGTGNNMNSLLLAGSAGTPASALAGNLAVSVSSGLQLNPATLYVVFQDNGPNPFTGAFANAPQGQNSLTSTDGAWQFGVTYANNQVFLYNATAVPEPSTYAALAGLASLALVAFRHHGTRRA